jgi:hypothetical protein
MTACYALLQSQIINIIFLREKNKKDFQKNPVHYFRNNIVCSLFDLVIIIPFISPGKNVVFILTEL